MPQNLWLSTTKTGTAANRPPVSEAFPDSFQLYLATDTNEMSVAQTTSAGVPRAFVPVGKSGSQPVPGAETSQTVTISPAYILNGLVTSTQAAAVTATLATGAVTDAGIASGQAPLRSFFDWHIINLGSASGAVTVQAAASGHTIIGLATVAINTTGAFRTVKTAADTFITYRLGS